MRSARRRSSGLAIWVVSRRWTWKYSGGHEVGLVDAVGEAFVLVEGPLVAGGPGPFELLHGVDVLGGRGPQLGLEPVQVLDGVPDGVFAGMFVGSVFVRCWGGLGLAHLGVGVGWSCLVAAGGERELCAGADGPGGDDVGEGVVEALGLVVGAGGGLDELGGLVGAAADDGGHEGPADGDYQRGGDGHEDVLGHGIHLWVVLPLGRVSDRIAVGSVYRALPGFPKFIGRGDVYVPGMSGDGR